MNRNQVIGTGLAGVLVFGDIMGAFAMGKDCARNCLDVPFAVIPEIVTCAALE